MLTAGVLAACIAVVLAQGQTTKAPPTGSTEQPGVVEEVYCQAANGTVPDWLDATCSRYFVCVNFNLTTETCPDGQAFSFQNESCVDAANLDCAAQNQELLTSLQWRAQQGPVPQSVPHFPGLTGLAGLAGQGGLPQFGASLPSARPPTVVVFSEEACRRLGRNVELLETVTNSAMMIMANCQGAVCEIPLFDFTCN